MIHAGNETILIEGPSGAGKTTVARLLSVRYGYQHFNTGIPFRASAAGILHGRASLNELMSFIGESTYAYDLSDSRLQHAAVNGQDVSELLQTPKVANLAVAIGANSAAQSLLEKSFDAQLPLGNRIVIEGKHFGNRFTHGIAAHIFLIASQGIRAQRKYEQALSQGKSTSLLEIRQDMIRNDFQDRRLLQFPAGAILHDSSHETPHETAEAILSYIQNGAIDAD